jgi:hypothetical protein
MDANREKRLSDLCEMFKFIFCPGGCYKYDGEIGTGRFISDEELKLQRKDTQAVSKYEQLVEKSRTSESEQVAMESEQVASENEQKALGSEQVASESEQEMEVASEESDLSPPSSPQSSSPPQTPGPEHIINRLNEISKEDLVAMIKNRIADLELQIMTRTEDLQQIRERGEWSEDNSDVYSSEFYIFYSERMIEYFRETILMLEGKNKLKCNKNGDYLDCTCKWYFMHADGRREVTEKGTCKPCIERESARWLGINPEYQVDGIITRSKVTGPSVCMCAYCIAGSVRVRTSVNKNKRALMPILELRENCFRVETDLRDVCDVCVFKLAASLMV